jgi:hypothetical protein
MFENSRGNFKMKKEVTAKLCFRDSFLTATRHNPYTGCFYNTVKINRKQV